MDTNTLMNRMLRAARLDTTLYNEVEGDTTLNQEALIVVIIASLATGIGGFLGGLLGNAGIGGAIFGLIVAIIMGVIGYYIWAYVTYYVGTRLFGGTADAGELLRTLGYASAVRVLGILSFIPILGWLISLIAAIWSLVAGVIAIREALDFDTTKALLTVIVGWLVVFVVNLLVTSILGLGAAGLGAILG